MVKNHAFVSGYDTLCCECNRRRVKEWRNKNPEKRKTQVSKETSIRISCGKAAKATAKHRAARKIATYFVNDEFSSFIIEEAYNLSSKRTKATGITWQVDHIIPIKHREVCGLHTGYNLQVIPEITNKRKSNNNNMNNYTWTGY